MRPIKFIIPSINLNILLSQVMIFVAINLIKSISLTNIFPSNTVNNKEVRNKMPLLSVVLDYQRSELVCLMCWKLHPVWARTGHLKISNVYYMRKSWIRTLLGKYVNAIIVTYDRIKNYPTWILKQIEIQWLMNILYYM